MKERPILMSAPMVRAHLRDIDPKTNTRRGVKKWHFVPGNEDINLSFSGLQASEVSPGFWKLSSRGDGGCWEERVAAICPYGKPGDRLWVRETFIPWRYTSHESTEYDTLTRDVTGVSLTEWVADHGHQDVRICYSADGPEEGPWMPSIFMPRWASRILLEIKSVRMERLLRISAEDAIAEGLTKLSKDGGQTWKYGIPDRDGEPGNDDIGWQWSDWDVDPRKAYFRLWDKINGEGSAQLNPWVWAVHYRRVEVC